MLEEFRKISINRNKKVCRLFLVSGIVVCIPLILSSYKYIGQFSFKTFIFTGYHMPYVIMAFLGLVLWILALLETIKTYSGSYLLKLKEDVQRSGYSPEIIDADFASAVSCYSFRMGKLMLYFLEKQNKIARAYSTKRILWAYYGEFPSKTNKVTRKGILIYVEGRQCPIELIVPSLEKAAEYLKVIETHCPWVIMDYSKELEDLYINNRNMFKSKKYDIEIAKAE